MASGGTSQENSSSFGSTFVDESQQPFLDELRAKALEALGPLGGLVSQGQERADAASRRAQSLIGQATGASALNNQIDVLRSNLTQNLQENILPGIQSRFGMSGTGGGRRDLAAQLQGVAGTQRALSSGIAQLQGQHADRSIQGAALQPDIFNLGISGFRAGADPLLALQQIIGSPTILGQQESSSSGKKHQGSILFG